ALPRDPHPPLRRRRRPQPVRERLREQRGRAPRQRPRHGRRPRLDRHRAAGDGRRRGIARMSCLETRRSAALTAVGNTPLVELPRMYGAEIVFSPRPLGSNGAVAMGRSMAERDPSVFMPFQYANEANPAAHYRGTAVEILEQVPDGQVDAFVAGLGTGGTLMGNGRRLREANPDVQVVAAEPLQGDPVMGLRSLEDGYTPPILDIRELDRKVLVSNAESVLALRKLLELEGIFAGVSAGAALAVARRVAADLEEGQNVVVLFADGGSKYLSAGLYTTPIDELEAKMEERVWW